MREISVKVRIEGRVQGVWFRGWTRQEAVGLGLRGWVRNEADGSVVVVLAGPEARVQEMIAGLHRGPPSARVRDLRWEEMAEGFEGEGFGVRR